MNDNQLTKLKNELKIKPVDASLNIKDKQKIVCLICSNIFEAIPKNRIIQYSNYGTIGCPSCSKKNHNEKRINQLISKIPDKFEIIKQNRNHLTNGSIIKVINKICKHTFDTKIHNIIYGNINCPICAKEEQKKRGWTRKDGSTIKKEITLTKDIIIKRLKDANENNDRNIQFKNNNFKFKGILEKYDFICENGHTFESILSNVLHPSVYSGCPICAKNNYSKKCIKWLEDVMNETGLFIQHAENIGEYKIPGTNYYADGYCKETNTIYEYNGYFFHGDPIVYAPEDIISYGKISKEQYQKTLQKLNDIKSLGYNLIVEWEKKSKRNNNIPIKKIEQILNINFDYTYYGWSYDGEKKIFIFDVDKIKEQIIGRYFLQEIYNKYENSICIMSDELINNFQLVIEKIKHILGMSNKPKIYARKCIINKVSNKDKNIFLKDNHIQGTAISQINYGAYYNNELVAIMTFSKPRIIMDKKYNEKQDVYELVRYATNKNYQVIGTAGKLLKHFIKNNNYKKIFSYADQRWSQGNMYKQIGFYLDSISKPDYYYIIDHNRKHRWGFRKSSIKYRFPEVYSENKTEYQMMLEMGYDRIWDCGKMKFVLDK